MLCICKFSVIQLVKTLCQNMLHAYWCWRTLWSFLSNETIPCSIVTSLHTLRNESVLYKLMSQSRHCHQSRTLSFVFQIYFMLNIFIQQIKYICTLYACINSIKMHFLLLSVDDKIINEMFSIMSICFVFILNEKGKGIWCLENHCFMDSLSQVWNRQTALWTVHLILH